MNMMTYDGYIATLEIDEDSGVISGIVANVRAVFVDTIADYRAWCTSEGSEPEKPYSGTLSLRLPPDLHRKVVAAAAMAGKSVNEFITETLEAVAV